MTFASTQQPKSRYETIWDTLKEKKVIRISVPAEHHRRLKLAIIKRKNKDLGFKYLLKESNQRSQLHFKSDGNILHVALNISERSLWIWPNRIPKDLLSL